jgi:hypothetical protein
MKVFYFSTIFLLIGIQESYSNQFFNSLSQQLLKACGVVNRLETPTEAYTRLNRKVPGKTNFIPSSDSHFYSVLERVHKGKRLGYLAFAFIEKNKVYIDYVMAKKRRKGYATLLFLELIQKYPEIEEIQSILTGSNKFEYQRALQNQYSHADAIKKTPAYKIRKTIGFPSIMNQDSNLNGPLSLVVTPD